MSEQLGQVPTPEQQMPKPGSQDVTPVARDLFNAMLADRERKGIETYGTTLQAHNGRDAVRDAMEECIDLWQYLVQIRMERDAWKASAERADGRVAALREALGLAIADLTNLSELRILTGQYRTEANELVERLSAALAAAGREGQRAGDNDRG